MKAYARWPESGEAGRSVVGAGCAAGAAFTVRRETRPKALAVSLVSHSGGELLTPCIVSSVEFRRAVMITFQHWQPLAAIIAGILILIVPRLLSFIVAIYLILIGIDGLGLIHY